MPVLSERHLEVLRAALQLFSERGYAGASLRELARRLGGLPGVEMVAPFGATLHVSGSDAAALDAALAVA